MNGGSISLSDVELTPIVKEGTYDLEIKNQRETLKNDILTKKTR